MPDGFPDGIEEMRDREMAERAERERAFDHTPVEDRDDRSMSQIMQDETDSIDHAEAAAVPLRELPWAVDGFGLYARVRGLGGAYWRELDDRQREMWARVERYVAHQERMRLKPGPLRFEQPESVIQKYERHCDAVEAVLGSQLLDPLGLSGRIQAARLREVTEAILAAADTGI